MTETAFSPLKSLECLSRVFPINGAVVVGAGMGDGPWFDLLVQQAIGEVLLVEADQKNVQHLERKYSSRNQWDVLHQVVSDKEEERVFYRLSNSAESGMLEPELLRSLWPNISIKEEQLCQTVTLDSLIHANNPDANWLVIDCLPAISMLNGADKSFSAFDVAVVRLVIGNDVAPPLCDVRQDVDTIMRKHGFINIGIESGLHPSLGHAVYIRDIPHQTVALKGLSAELEELRAEWHEQGTAWEQEKKELQQAKTESDQQAGRKAASQQQRIDELTKNLQVAQQELAEQQVAQAELIERARIEAEKQQAHLLEQGIAWEQEKKELQQAKTESDQQAGRQAASQQQRIDELTKNLQVAQQELDERTQAHKAIVEQAKADADRMASEIQEHSENWCKKNEELDRLQGASAELKQLNAKLQVQIDIASQEKLAAAQEADRKTQEYQQLKSTNASLLGKIAELENEAVTLIKQDQEKQIEELSSQVDQSQQAKELTRMLDTLSQSVKKEITSAIKQLEAFFGIQSYFESGQVMGEFHGWPISPDLAFYLIQQLEAKSYDLVIEFGSGTSTQIIAKTHTTIAQRQPTRTKPIQVAFEHLARFHQKNLSLLQQSGLAEAVALYHTPLQPYTGPDGVTYSYYDCEPVLHALAEASTKPMPVILALVDGPPGSTGTHARYPALPLLLKHFPEAQIDLILDDYNRLGEKEVANKWLNELEALQISHKLVEEKLDKGACKLIIKTETKKG